MHMGRSHRVFRQHNERGKNMRAILVSIQLRKIAKNGKGLFSTAYLLHGVAKRLLQLYMLETLVMVLL